LTIIADIAIGTIVFHNCPATIDAKATQLAANLGNAVSGYISDPAYGTIHKNYQTGAVFCKDGSQSAQVIYGGIYAKYLTLSNFGYPITDELGATDKNGRAGRYNLFSQSNAIYWTQEHDAHILQGGIYGTWLSSGGAQSFLGFPITDEVSSGTHGGLYTDFTGGMIYWRPGTGDLKGQGYAVSNPTLSPLIFNVDPLALSDVSGNTYIALNSNGGVSWQSKLHDSSPSVSFDWSIAWVVMNADGTAYEINRHGTISPNGDADIITGAFIADISDNWRAWVALTRTKSQSDLTLSYNQILSNLYDQLKSENPFIAAPIAVVF
jgi:uncharacterized protein with LGFP repeats